MKHDLAGAPDATAGLEGEPLSAEALFTSHDLLASDGLELARRYVAHLATTGVTHGLIGPRELPRLWTRHVINCAVLGEMVTAGATVVDVGSGAGLPGIPLAIARPDLDVTLLEPLERRCRWLTAVVDDLGLAPRVHVVRGRAQEVVGSLTGNVVVSRAIAPLPRLLDWCLPLVAPGGAVLAMKGDRAADELAGVEAQLKFLGVRSAKIELCGLGSVMPPVRVVKVVIPEGFHPETALELDRGDLGPGAARRDGDSGRGRSSAGPRRRRSRT